MGTITCDSVNNTDMSAKVYPNSQMTLVGMRHYMMIPTDPRHWIVERNLDHLALKLLLEILCTRWCVRCHSCQFTHLHQSRPNVAVRVLVPVTGREWKHSALKTLLTWTVPPIARPILSTVADTGSPELQGSETMVTHVL